PNADMRARVTAAVKVEFNRLHLEALAKWEAGGKKTDPPKALSVTCQTVANVIQALTGYTLLEESVTPPAWIGAGQPAPPEELIPCRNGLLHLPTLVAGGDDYLLPPTPLYFAYNELDFAIDLNAAPPAGWLDFLGQLWPDDRQSIDTLQEFFGY